MKTLAEIWELINSINDEAHSNAYDSWEEADEMEESDDEDSEEIAEQLREQASNEQAGYFREMYWLLLEEYREAIRYWLKEDESFKDEFSSWFGYEEFEEEFNDE
jgi:hypothetical protein